MKDYETELSHKILTSLLHYDPETGFFTRIIDCHAEKKGDKAGYKKKNNYVYIRVCGFRYCAHRLAYFYMNGKWPQNFIDHIDRDKHNNKWSNLRDATRSQNSFNRDISSKSSSGIAGVCWDGRKNRWRAYIKHDRKYINLGFYQDINDAALARRGAESRFYKEFASSMDDNELMAC